VCEGNELLAVSQTLDFVSHSIFKGRSKIQCLGYSLWQLGPTERATFATITLTGVQIFP